MNGCTSSVAICNAICIQTMRENQLYSPRQCDESRLKTLVLSLRHEVGEHDGDDRHGPHGSRIEERYEIVHAEVCRYLIV